MGNCILATYLIGGGKYSVFGCWDEETPEGKYDFYDVHDEKGNCLNEGHPFYELPSYAKTKRLVEARQEVEQA